MSLSYIPVITTPRNGRCLHAFALPSAAWYDPGFNDSQWQLPIASTDPAFGSIFIINWNNTGATLTAGKITDSNVVYNIPPNPLFYLLTRTYFTLPNVPAATVGFSWVVGNAGPSYSFSVAMDNVLNGVWLNGVPATSITYILALRSYGIVMPTSALLPGVNVIAMEVEKNNFGQCGVSLGAAVIVTYPAPPIDESLKAWLVVNEPGTGLTDQSHYLYLGGDAEHSFNLQSRQRGTASYTMVISSADPAANINYEPTIGSPMFLYDEPPSGYALVFAGLIQDFKNRQIGLGGNRYIDVTAVSLEAIFDTLLADQPQQFVNMACGDILVALFGTYATGSQVVLGTIQEGVTIPLFNTNYEKLSDLFTQLAVTSGYIWGVDPPTQSLYFMAPETVPAPFSLGSSGVMWDSINWDYDAADYRNRQAVRLSYDAFTHSAEFFTGSGQTQFTLLRAVDQVTNAYITLSTPNTATGVFTANPAIGETVTVGPASGAWQSSHVYGLNGVIVVAGFVQKVTTAGTSGGSEPVFSSVTGQTTTDNSVIWTCQGPLGLGTGENTYTFCQPDTSVTQPYFGQWQPNSAYPLDALVFIVGGMCQQAAAGTSGPTEPVWATNIGGTTGDGTITWTCLGPWFDNTQFGMVLIDSNFLTTTQNLADALNANPATRGVVYSLPTWENSQGNAINVTGATFTFEMKGAGTGYVASLSAISFTFAWSSTVTSGGTSPQGSVGPNDGATISIQVYAVGTSSAAPALSYTQGSNIVNLATPLNAGTNLNVEYTRPDGNVIEVENTPLVNQLAAQTYGLGKVQQISDQSQQGLVSVNAAAGLQLAQQALAAFDVVPLAITLDILVPGIYPGQQCSIALAAWLSLLNAAYYVEEVTARLVPCWPWMEQTQTRGGGHYRYTIKLIDITQIGSYMDFWQGLGGGGGAGAGNGGGGGGGGSSLVATSGGIQSQSGNSLVEGGVNYQGANDYTAQTGDYGRIIEFNDPSFAHTLTLPASPPFAQWNIFVENAGAANLFINPNGLLLDKGSGGLTIPQNQGVYISTDGANYYTSRGLLPSVTVGAMQFITSVTVGALTNKISFPAIPNTFNHLQIVYIAAGSDGVWSALTGYALGTILVVFNSVTTHYYYWKVTTAGTSGASIPAFATTSSGTLSDGSVTWTNQGQDNLPNTNVAIVFNTDTNPANYFWSYIQQGSNGTTNPVGSVPAGGPSILSVGTPRNGRTQIPVSGTIWIPFYKSTVFGKEISAVSGAQVGTPGAATNVVNINTVGYLPTSVIFEIDFYVQDGTYFAAGSSFILYGIF
jgi:hypothetical protein